MPALKRNISLFVTYRTKYFDFIFKTIKTKNFI